MFGVSHLSQTFILVRNLYNLDFYYLPVENEAALSFIKTLAACTESQIDEKLMSTVQVSTAALTKIIQAYDYVLAKSERTLAVLKSIPEDAGGFYFFILEEWLDQILLQN